MANTEKKIQMKNKNQARKDDASATKKMKKRKCFYYKKQGHYIIDLLRKKDDKERIRDATVTSDDSFDMNITVLT